VQKVFVQEIYFLILFLKGEQLVNNLLTKNKVNCIFIIHIYNCVFIKIILFKKLPCVIIKNIYIILKINKNEKLYYLDCRIRIIEKFNF